MIETAPLSIAPPIAAPSSPLEPAPGPDETAPETSWREDLRFFLTCYACGFVAFLVMLS